MNTTEAIAQAESEGMCRPGRERGTWEVWAWTPAAGYHCVKVVSGKGRGAAGLPPAASGASCNAAGIAQGGGGNLGCWAGLKERLKTW